MNSKQRRKEKRYRLKVATKICNFLLEELYDIRDHKITIDKAINSALCLKSLISQLK